MPLLRCTPSPVPDEVAEAARNWEQREHSHLFVLTGAQLITRQLADWIYTQRRAVEKTTALDIIIDCNGGSADPAYQLVELFRSMSGKVRVFVPDWAKSAATLFCLGADEIWMSRTAELGPLDAQIADPRDPDKYISALEEFRAVDHLRTVAFETLDELMRTLLRRTRMRMRDVVSESRQFAAQIVEPLLEQVDPLYFGTAYRALETSTEYGKRVMARHAYKDWSEERIQEVVYALTWTYPSHTFIIDYEEAKRLGLKVFLLEGVNDETAHTITSGMQECIGFLGAEVTRPEAVIPEPAVRVVAGRGGDGT